MVRNVRRVIILLLTLAVVLIISISSLWNELEGLTQPWLSPITRASSATGNWFDRFWSLSAVVEENENLKHQVAELVARQSTSDALKSENDELRQLISLPTPVGYERLAVEIIGQQIDESGVSYLINRGQSDGLVVGLAAVAGAPSAGQDTSGLVLVGTIKDVGQHVASLTLITSSSSQVLAKLAQGPAGQSLAIGEYNLAVRLKFLEIDQELSVGDAVVTSNLNSLIPSGILIGTVTALERLEGELFQSAVVSPPAPLEQFRFLYVLRPVEPI